MKLFSSTGGKIPNNAKERKESKEEKENTTKSSIKVNIAKATSSSNNSVSSSSSSSFTVESTIKNNNVLDLMKSDSDGDDEDDKDFLPEYNNEREESKLSASTSESDTSEGLHKNQKIRPSMAVHNIDLLGKRVRITFSDRVATGLYKEGAKGKKYQVQGDHVLAYRLFEKGLEKSLRHVLPAAAYQQLTRFVVRENVMTEDQLNRVLEENKEILKNLISNERREKILKALETLPEEKKVTAGALDAYNSIYYSVACSHLAEEYLRFRNKKAYSAFLPIPKYPYISKGAEAQHVHDGIQGLSHQYHILSERLEEVSFGKQEGDEVRVILIERTDEEEQLAVEKNIAKNIFKLFFYPKVDGMDLSEEKEDKESESGNRTNNLHTLAKVIENSLITVFNIYPIFWYLREKITDAFVRQVALEGVVEIPGKKDKSGPVQTESRPVNWGLDQKSYDKVLDEVNRDMKAVCDLKKIGEELDINVEAKKEARKEELLEDIEWCLMDQEAEKKDEKKRDEKKQGDISSQKLQAATAAKEVDSHSQSMVSEEQGVPLIKTTQSHLIYNTRGHQHDREEASGKVGSDNSSKKDKSTIDKTKTENKLS